MALAVDVSNGPELPGGKMKNKTSQSILVTQQPCHNNLFGDDMVIWFMAFGFVVPIMTYDDSSLLIYTPELHKMTFSKVLEVQQGGREDTGLL